MCAQKYMPNVNSMLPFISITNIGDVKKNSQYDSYNCPELLCSILTAYSAK